MYMHNATPRILWDRYSSHVGIYPLRPHMFCLFLHFLKFVSLTCIHIQTLWCRNHHTISLCKERSLSRRFIGSQFGLISYTTPRVAGSTDIQLWLRFWRTRQPEITATVSLLIGSYLNISLIFFQRILSLRKRGQILRLPSRVES